MKAYALFIKTVFFTLVGIPEIVNISPEFISNGGIIGGHFNNAPFDQGPPYIIHGFIYDLNTSEIKIIDYDDNPDTVTSFTGMNDHGEISGYYTSGSGFWMNPFIAKQITVDAAYIDGADRKMGQNGVIELSGETSLGVSQWHWELVHNTQPEFNASADGMNVSFFDLMPGFYDITLTVTTSEGHVDTAKAILAMFGLPPNTTTDPNSLSITSDPNKPDLLTIGDLGMNFDLIDGLMYRIKVYIEIEDLSNEFNKDIILIEKTAPAEKKGGRITIK